MEKTTQFAERRRLDADPGDDVYFKQLIQATDECIAHHPWGAIGFALAFGLLGGMILARRAFRVERACGQ